MRSFPVTQTFTWVSATLFSSLHPASPGQLLTACLMDSSLCSGVPCEGTLSFLWCGMAYLGGDQPGFWHGGKVAQGVVGARGLGWSPRAPFLVEQYPSVGTASPLDAHLGSSQM